MSELRKYAKRVKKPYPTLYHISFNGTLEGVWQPKSPDGDYDPSVGENMHGEPTDARISFSPTIEQAFQAVYANIKHLFDRYPYLLFYVYQPIFKGNERIVTPEEFSKHRLVHDAHVTGEHSVLDPVEMRLTGRVKIWKPSDENRIDYYAFDVKDREPYGWLPGDIKVEEVSLEAAKPVTWLRW